MAERRRLEAWIQELEARAVAADERADAAESELDELRELHGNLQQDRRQELEPLHQERSSLKAELERHVRQKHDLGEALQTAQLEIASQQTQIATLQSQIASQQAQVATLQSQISSHQTQTIALQSQIAALQSQLVSEQARAAALEQKLASSSDDSENAEELRRLESLLAERGEHIRSLERDLREAERTGRELVRRLERPNAPVAAPPAPSASAERVAELEAERLVLTWALAIARGEPTSGARPALPSLPKDIGFNG
jgi:chromosome segregation ATPase